MATTMAAYLGRQEVAEVIVARLAAHRLAAVCRLRRCRRRILRRRGRGRLRQPGGKVLVGQFEVVHPTLERRDVRLLLGEEAAVLGGHAAGQRAVPA